MSLYSVFPYFCLPSGFVFIQIMSIWNPEIPGFCVSEIKRNAYRHKQVQNIESSVVL